MILFISLIIFVLNIHSQELKQLNNKAFKQGEKLTYVVYFDSFITGKYLLHIIMMVSPNIEYINNRPCYHLLLVAKHLKNGIG